jgi:hypothetical protein
MRCEYKNNSGDIQLTCPTQGLTVYKALKQTNLHVGQWVAISGAGGGLGHLGELNLFTLRAPFHLCFQLHSGPIRSRNGSSRTGDRLVPVSFRVDQPNFIASLNSFFLIRYRRNQEETMLKSRGREMGGLQRKYRPHLRCESSYGRTGSRGGGRCCWRCKFYLHAEGGVNCS